MSHATPAGVLDLERMHQVDICKKGIDATAGYAAGLCFYSRIKVPGSRGTIMTFGVVIDAEFTQWLDRKT